jgi:hypothetical protein
MNDRMPDRAPDTHPRPGPAAGAGQPDGGRADDVEGHSATIYRRRGGPYPLRHGAPLPDADDRRRGERLPSPHRVVR